MTSSDNFVCGTGGWLNLPKPGDPDNNVLLTATPAFGGIDINFTYPKNNPHAIAYVNLYRGTTNKFEQAVRLVVLSGNFYYDRITTEYPVEYFYWVQIVSVNGTTLEPIGPASAFAKPLIADLMYQLTGKIDRGVLSNELRTELARIDYLEDGLTQEAEYRKSSTDAAAAAFEGLQASFDETAALVLRETEVRSNADSAIARQINTVQSAWGNELSSVQQTMETQINTIGGEVKKLGALYTVKVDVNGLVGGFGVYNDGKEIEAGFDVDRFWVGKSGSLIKPFIIDGGTTYVNDAAINKLTFSKLRDESGSLIVQDGKVQAKYLVVDNASIVNGAITDAKIANGTISNAKIANAAITSAKIQDGAITHAKIGTAEVDRLNLRDGAVTFIRTFTVAAYHGATGKNAWENTRSVSFSMPSAGECLIFYELQNRNSGNGRYDTRLYFNGELLGDTTTWEIPLVDIRRDENGVYYGVHAITSSPRIFTHYKGVLRAGTNTFQYQKKQYRNGYWELRPGHDALVIKVLAWFK